MFSLQRSKGIIYVPTGEAEAKVRKAEVKMRTLKWPMSIYRYPEKSNLKTKIAQNPFKTQGLFKHRFKKGKKISYKIQGFS